MSEARRVQAKGIIADLRRHPRVAYQSVVGDEEKLACMRDSFPLLVPFGEIQSYAGFIPVLDWDHHLPSHSVILRVYAYYTRESLAAGASEVNARTIRIDQQSKFPEFDVPDYSGIRADEAYDAEVGIDSGEVSRVRLVSTWRRSIDTSDASSAVRVARSSAEFRELVEQSSQRPDYLGDLEAVSWTPPCESSFDIWTIDCWYLMHLDTSVGKGRSFLVDSAVEAVVGVREFVVRSG